MTIKNLINGLLHGMFAILLGTCVLSCGGGGDSGSPSESNPGQSASILLTINGNNLPADGESSATITAKITDISGKPVRHYTEVTFSTGLGYFKNASKTITVKTQPPLGDDGLPDWDAAPTGTVQIAFIAGIVPGKTYVTASSIGVTQAISINLIRSGKSQLSIQATPSSIPADGISQSLVTATITSTLGVSSSNTSGAPISNVPVTFYDVTDAEQSTELPADNTYTGNGSAVTDPFYAEVGLLTFTMSNEGNSNFIIWLWNDDTKTREDLIENEIGPRKGDIAAFEVETAGNYFFVVKAEGSWSITIDGNIKPPPKSVGLKVLAIKRTDGNGRAQFHYTSTTRAENIIIKAETGEASNSEDTLNGQVTILQTGLEAANISLTATPDIIPANGQRQTIIEANVTDKNGNKVADGTNVMFQATIGTIEGTAKTVDGIASVKLTSSKSAETIQSTVTGTVGEYSDTVNVTFLGVSLTNMQATPPAIFANGTDQSVITVRLEDADGVAVSGETISFSTTLGTLSAAAATTDANGTATVNLIAPTTTGTGTITATYGTITENTTVSFEAVKDGSITLTAEPASIPADGTSTSVITATIKYSSGEAVPKGTPVTFTTNLGTFSDGSQSYTVITPDETGIVAVSLTAGITPGSAKITASAINISQTIYVAIGGSAITITLAANPSSILADGTSSSSITATLKDSSGAAVTPGTQVTFTTDLGTFSNGTQIIIAATPDGTGTVTVSLISATTPGFATVTATSGGVSQSVSVGFTGGVVTTITLSADPTSIPADGSSSSSITAELKSAAGSAVPAGTSATFTTTLGTFSNGTTSITTSTTDDSGKITVSLIAGETAGTAKVVCASQGVSQKVEVELTGGSGTPASLSLSVSQTSVKSDNSDSSTVTATVLDANKAALQGIVVAFQADGGQLSASSGETDANGQTQVTFSSGTTDRSNQTVTITATVSGLSAQTIPIQITGSTLEISAVKTNLTVEEATKLTVTAKDAGGNLVYGAPITFSISGSQVTVSPTSGSTDVSGQLSTTVTAAVDGSATVTAKWSADPQAAQAFTVGTTGNVFEILLPSADPFSAKTRSTAANTVSGVSVTFKDNGSGNPDTIEAAGAFAGFAAGEVIMVGGTTSNNGIYTLSSTVAPTANVLTLSDSDALTDKTTTAAIVTNGVLVWVRAPDPIANLKFATSIGTWDNGGSPIVTKSVSASNYSWAVLTASVAGSATVQVSDAADSSTEAYTTVAFAVPSEDAAQLNIMSNVYTVAPSVGGIKNTATLTATVRASASAGGQAVSGATVAFSIENPTGGGETVKPVVKITNDAGQATTTFTSGSLSSGAGGVIVRGTTDLSEKTASNTTIAFGNSNPDTITRSDGSSFVTDGFQAGDQISVKGSTSNDGYYTLATVAAATLTLVNGDALTAEAAGASVTITHVITDTVSIVIGGTAGSVVIGRGTVIYDQDEATYRLPMSALVTDSNGNAVSGAVVTLSAWPSKYAPGVWYDTDPLPQSEKYAVYYTGTFIDNEDANENLILDPGEDKDGDGKLTPANSSAGGVPVPSEVTTDENGVAAFNLIYLKAQAKWINSRIRASTYVVGTETTSSLNMVLPAEETQAEEGLLPDSPYPIGLVTDTASNVTYTFPVFQGTGDSFTPSANLSAGSSSVAGYLYTYNPTTAPAAKVGDWIWDYITVINSTAGLGAYFPVRIIIE